MRLDEYAFGLCALTISTHAPLARCDTFVPDFWSPRIAFQLTHLLRGATRVGIPSANTDKNFNSRTSCEVRPPKFLLLSWIIRFQLTHLLRGATCPPSQTAPGERFQLTHLLRGATDQLVYRLYPVQISTHAPLARCDRIAELETDKKLLISTHAPLARCDLNGRCADDYGDDFNSRTSCEVRRYF